MGAVKPILTEEQQRLEAAKKFFGLVPKNDVNPNVAKHARWLRRLAQEEERAQRAKPKKPFLSLRKQLNLDENDVLRFLCDSRVTTHRKFQFQRKRILKSSEATRQELTRLMAKLSEDQSALSCCNVRDRDDWRGLNTATRTRIRRELQRDIAQGQAEIADLESRLKNWEVNPDNYTFGPEELVRVYDVTFDAIDIFLYRDIVHLRASEPEKNWKVKFENHVLSRCLDLGLVGGSACAEQDGETARPSRYTDEEQQDAAIALNPGAEIGGAIKSRGVRFRQDGSVRQRGLESFDTPINGKEFTEEAGGWTRSSGEWMDSGDWSPFDE